MKVRFQIIRKSTKLNQLEFGKSLGVTENVISNIERGVYEPSETLKMLLCMKYNINPEWLETGEGSMHKSNITNGVNNIDILLTELIASMSDHEKHLVCKILQTITDKTK